MVTKTPGRSTAQLSQFPLPEALRRLRDENPWEEVGSGARAHLMTELPALADAVQTLPTAVFGLPSGFFYLPAAINREWHAGLSVPDLLVTLALGHVFFAFQDRIIDEGFADARLCLLSHEALLAYLDRVGAMLSGKDGRARAVSLHRAHYARYTRAVAVDLAHRGQIVEYRAAEVAGLGGKAAPGNTVLEIIAERAGHAEASEDLVASVMSLCAALQVLDDLNDLAIDRRDGNMTMPLTLLLTQASKAEIGTGELRDEDLEAVAVASGVASAVLTMALTLLQQAAREARQAGAHVVDELAGVWIQRTAARRSHYDGARDQLRTDIGRP